MRREDDTSLYKVLAVRVPHGLYDAIMEDANVLRASVSDAMRARLETGSIDREVEARKFLLNGRMKKEVV
jgi:hypothetical protein